MTNKMIDNRIDKIRALQEEAAKLTAQIDAIKDELKAELDTRKVDSVNTGSHKVFYSCYEQRRVDSKKLKEAGLYDKYSNSSVVTQFKITDVTVTAS